MSTPFEEERNQALTVGWRSEVVKSHASGVGNEYWMDEILRPQLGSFEEVDDG